MVEHKQEQKSNSFVQRPVSDVLLLRYYPHVPVRLVTALASQSCECRRRVQVSETRAWPRRTRC